MATDRLHYKDPYLGISEPINQEILLKQTVPQAYNEIETKLTPRKQKKPTNVSNIWLACEGSKTGLYKF